MADIESREHAERILEEVKQDAAALRKPTNYEEFERGVQLAKKSMERVLYIHGTPAESFFGLISSTTLSVEFIDSVISISDKSRLAYDYLLQVASHLLRDYEPLPENLREWLVDVLDDMVSKEEKRPYPKKETPGPDEFANYARDNAIRITTLLLVRGGWTEVGNEASIKTDDKTGKEWTNSAVFAVAKATGMSFEVVKSARLRPIGEK